MNLVQALRLHSESRIAFVGAGGKTSSMFHLARQYSHPILLTATTHLAENQKRLADHHFIMTGSWDSLDPLIDSFPTGITLVTGPIDDSGRTIGIVGSALDGVEMVAKRFSTPLLIEADGARGKFLKAPAEHEPAFPDVAVSGVVLAGLSALGQPLTDEIVHRPEIFAPLSGLSIGEPITIDAIAAVLLHEQGGLKNMPSYARPVALLNHVSTPELAAEAQRLAAKLLPHYHAVISADIPHYSESRESIIHAAYQPAAAVILAAGDSKRFGRPKQLLDWKGKPFIRSIAETALEAGLGPVVVVTGAHGEQVAAALDGLALEVVHNPQWETGQSSSVQAGLAALPPSTGAAIFLLSDQPQIPATLMRALVAKHAETLAPIIAPEIAGRRGNPVLFDRATFPDFAALTGDVGGRAIFSRYKVAWLPWLDESLLLDVDTPADYEKLLASAR